MSFTFPRDSIFLIAGPCVLESDALNLRVGEHLARLAERVPGGIVYKASFDKANRSNAGAARGPGLDEGLAALERGEDRPSSGAIWVRPDDGTVIRTSLNVIGSLKSDATIVAPLIFAHVLGE